MELEQYTKLEKAKRRFGLNADEASEAIDSAMNAWHGIKSLSRIAKNVKNRHYVD